jgi:2-amino-4-hydroxy-6-hydroxymethyldihydropteridine diphosphokinase
MNKAAFGSYLIKLQIPNWNLLFGIYACSFNIEIPRHLIIFHAMSHVYLSLGSNSGCPECQIRHALRRLGPATASRVRAVSSWYRSEPLGFRRQPWFINIAAQLETALPPREFAARAFRLEQGKKASFPNGPRKLDIDILFYNDLVFYSPTLEIPHPRIAERKFVLDPLAEIAPDFIHPAFHLSIRKLSQKVCPRIRGQRIVRLEHA